MSRVERVVLEAVGEGYEFWKGDAEDTLKEVAKVLLDSGMPGERVAQAIGTVWWTALAECGL